VSTFGSIVAFSSSVSPSGGNYAGGDIA
jgi:hypothetical protein